jgi:hypothetical protein
MQLINTITKMETITGSQLSAANGQSNVCAFSAAAAQSVIAHNNIAPYAPTNENWLPKECLKSGKVSNSPIQAQALTYAPQDFRYNDPQTATMPVKSKFSFSVPEGCVAANCSALICRRFWVSLARVRSQNGG